MSQREIKFRAWDKLTGAMSPEFSLFGEFTLCGAVHDWQREESEIHNDSIGRLNDLIIMQFTGLLDKNGKEIYEGDILKHRSGLLTNVVFDVRTGSFVQHVIIGGVIMNVWKLRHSIPRKVLIPEVAGNIYSNPELFNP